MRKPGKPALPLSTPYLVLLVVTALVVAAVASGFVWAKKGVTVVVNGQSAYHTTEADTVSVVLTEMGIRLDDGDIVSPLPSTRIADGAEIVVRQAVPVTLTCNGTEIELNVVGTTVADALVAAGLDPSVGLAVNPSVDTTLSSEMTITATDVFLRIAREEGEIPYETIEQEDPTLTAGQRRVVQEGVVGRALCVFEVLVVGDVETTRTAKAQQVLCAPVAEIVKVGTKVSTPVVAEDDSDSSPNSSSPSSSSSAAALHTGADSSAAAPVSGTTMRVTATAYTPWDPGCSGISAINRRIVAYSIPAGWGIIAVDRSVISLGTRVYVPGYGYAIAADTGGAIDGARIDVCYWDGGSAVARWAALAWGSRTVTITIVD